MRVALNSVQVDSIPVRSDFNCILRDFNSVQRGSIPMREDLIPVHGAQVWSHPHRDSVPSVRTYVFLMVLIMFLLSL